MLPARWLTARLRLMDKSTPSANPRKRSVSMISQCAKLGHLTSSSGRSERFSKTSKLSTANAEAAHNSGQKLDPPASKERTWHSTSLGAKVENNEYVIKPQDTVFSVMSYNVLADELMLRHNNLYNKNIEDDVMRWEPRFERLKQEIIHYDCDILCCQEVQELHFHSHFKQSLNEMGYDVIYKKRTGDKSDGCAIFYNIEKFDLVDSLDVEYMQPSAPLCLNRDNIGLVAKLRPKNGPEDNLLCVATTHLLFNPKRDDIRLAQTAVLLAELDRFAWTGEQGSPYLPVILTGDFNCTVDSNVISLLTKGFCKSFGPFPPRELGINDCCQHVNVVNSRALGRDAAQVLNDKLFHSVRNKEPAVGHNDPSFRRNASIRHKFGFRSVYNPYEWPKPVTTKQNRYTMVDYVFYSTYYSKYLQKHIESNLKLLGRVNLYTEKDCIEMGDLPNELCPSDHLSLVAHFLLTVKKKYN